MKERTKQASTCKNQCRENLQQYHKPRQKSLADEKYCLSDLIVCECGLSIGGVYVKIEIEGNVMPEVELSVRVGNQKSCINLTERANRSREDVPRDLHRSALLNM